VKKTTKHFLSNSQPEEVFGLVGPFIPSRSMATGAFERSDALAPAFPIKIS
jgi:hypothetical protein